MTSSWMPLRRPARLARAVVGITMMVIFAVLAPAAAQAATYTDEVIRSGPLQITSVVSSTMGSLQPSYESGWQIGVQTMQPLTGDLHLGIGLLSDPALAQGMTLEVWACSVRWVDRACSTGYASWLQPVSLADGIQVTHHLSQTHEVNEWDGNLPVWIVLRITTDSSIRNDAAADFNVVVWGEGILVELGPTSLARTGHDLGWQLALAVLMVGLSVPLLIAPVMRRRSNRTAQAAAAICGGGSPS